MCSVTVVVRPHTVSLLQHLSSCAMNVTTAATGSTKGARALLRPPVTNIPSAFTKPSLWNQIHCVARQITSRRPPTPAQSSHILALMFFPPLPPPPSPAPTYHIQSVRWKMGVKNGCVFQWSHGDLRCSLSLRD